jgi:solute carrier family 25 citrate transporter 1
MKNATEPKKKKSAALNLFAGGIAGFVESSVCHPLDTIKTRMQLRRQQCTIQAVRARSSLHEPGMSTRSYSSLAEPKFTPLHSSLSEPSSIHKPNIHHAPTSPPVVTASLGPIGTARRIIQREGFFSLYKGLTAVYAGIVPKMAIRFLTFEQYREAMQKAVGPPDNGDQYSVSVNFSAGLASGLTEAILIVTPAEVCKIRMQAQYHSMMDPTQLSRRKYTNVFQTAFRIVQEEGIRSLYNGLYPTMLRQGCNQAVNFTTYNIFKKKVCEFQGKKELDHWQSLFLGGISGGFGPLFNNPLDVVKTRMQKQVKVPGKENKYRGITQSIRMIYKEEGIFALWKGITPRLMRIIPGQAITFMTYEAVTSTCEKRGLFQ